MEGKDVRRRLVQKTLFPHMETAIKECDNGLNGGEEEEEERCGSGKKQRGTKRKGNSKVKTTPPASSKKDMEKGNEIKSKQDGDSDSPVIAKSSFFVKTSERRQQKRQQNQLVSFDSPEENDGICSTPSSVASDKSTPQKPKQQNKSTPRKGKRNSTPNKRVKSGNRESCCGQIPFDLSVDEQLSQKIPDLRLEAKLTAEENSRIFAGRQIHPFFTSLKGVKTNQELINSESSCSSFGRKEKGIAFNPIHVFENVEDDRSTLKWGDWIFSERSATSEFPCGSSPVYEASIDSLNFDNYVNVSQLTRTSLCQNSHQSRVPEEGFFMGLPDNSEHSHAPSSLSFSHEKEISNEKKGSDMLPNYMKDTIAAPVELMLQDQKNEKNDFFDGISCGGNLESELQDKLLQERIMSNYSTCQNQPANCLWTDKYQPQNAMQICGNGESVKLISEWLHLWHTRGSLTIKGCMNEDTSSLQDIDSDYQQSDSDDNGEENLKNVLLVTGPVGSGKSAAIYACARDQGFQIIEINASDWRNGALIKQKFGEAVESHWLQRTVDNEVNSDSSRFFKAVNAETQSSDDEVIEPRHFPDKKDFGDACSSPKKPVPIYNRTINGQSEIKTLILFEDVDAMLCEDHGFITTIQQLAETAKRPMILTSNSDNPVLPKNLDRLELRFSVPSFEKLLGLVYMITDAEKAEIHPHLLKRFVDYCRGDIRKTIMLLQFWCQGQALGRGIELQTYWPVPFDLDAGHHILPKAIHWGYPSQLSELVAEEVVKSLTLMEETRGLTGRIKVDKVNYNITEDMCVQDIKPDPVEMKKATMLRLQGSHGEDEFARFEAYSELFDFTCSPVESAPKNHRRKINTVLSSDSEDDPTCESIPLVPNGLDINAQVSTFHCLSAELCGAPPEPIFPSEVNRLEDNCQIPERVGHSHTEDTCRSDDMSFMPELSFVPETEIIQETELYSTTVTYGNFANPVESNCLFQEQDSISFRETDVGTQSSKPLDLLENAFEARGNNLDTSTPCVYQEEVGDSLAKSEADAPKGFQFLDECSRIDFIRKLKSQDNPEADQEVDVVEETWKRLHDQCNDMKKYVTTEEKTACQVLVMAHGISSLISETDLLLRDCRTVAYDSLEPSMVPSEKTHSYSYHDSQLEMSSVLAQHGMCFYAKEIASLGSIMGCPNPLDLASEMLSSSSSSVALGKLAGLDKRKVDIFSKRTTKSSIVSTSKSDLCLGNILQTIVPSKLYLSAKGGAFHEYVSTLSQISRFEASRLSDFIVSKRKQRRSRGQIHYLSSGSLAMSSEEISLLGQYNSYQKSV